MPATTFFVILACAVLAGLIASLICYLISPNLGETATTISLIALLSLTIVGLIGLAAAPAQENAAEIQPSAANNIAIHTIQIIENDGTVSFEYRGDADAEIQLDRITFYDDNRTWTVFKNQNGTVIIAASE